LPCRMCCIRSGPATASWCRSSQSSWSPLTDRNPQRFEEIPFAKPEDFQKAGERVYRGGADGSQLRLAVVE